ncbi:hypothetical protein EYZ11_010262 [Aspergillus tanneri]|uniref:Uncharacterized protein n=1 Tax=Aspergillus tanneri TaxID=1220188 RepID=A0A4S3J5S9_9EURO|nr:hypothetical protein EYZ11_010262 [Aspergillus tanneri]
MGVNEAVTPSFLTQTTGVIGTTAILDTLIQRVSAEVTTE